MPCFEAYPLAGAAELGGWYGDSPGCATVEVGLAAQACVPRRRGHVPAVWGPHALARGGHETGRHYETACQARTRTATSSGATGTGAVRSAGVFVRVSHDERQRPVLGFAPAPFWPTCVLCSGNAGRVLNLPPSPGCNTRTALADLPEPLRSRPTWHLPAAKSTVQNSLAPALRPHP